MPESMLPKSRKLKDMGFANSPIMFIGKNKKCGTKKPSKYSPLRCLNPIMIIKKKVAIAKAKVVDQSDHGALNPNMLNMQQVSKYTKTIKYQGEMYESFSPSIDCKLRYFQTDSINFGLISLKLFSLSRAITASMIRKAIIIHVLKIVSVIQTSTLPHLKPKDYLYLNSLTFTAYISCFAKLQT